MQCNEMQWNEVRRNVALCYGLSILKTQPKFSNSLFVIRAKGGRSDLPIGDDFVEKGF